METETATKRLYEAMFLVDSAQAASDWDGTMGAIETVLKRADAEVVVLRKWSERRLAYDIGKVSRGTYLLCYFRAEPLRIIALEKDVRLSEMILRMLILSAEGRPEGFNEKDTSEEVPEAAKAADAAPAEDAAKESSKAEPEKASAPAEEAAKEPAEAEPEKAPTPAEDVAPVTEAVTDADDATPAESDGDAPKTEEVKEQ